MNKALLTAALWLAGSSALGQNWRTLEVDSEHKKAPNLIQWQRRLSDAESLSKRTGVPLLICVNMDGERACEAFAYRKYKMESFAELTRNFVPVIASPTRHNPTDYDERGRRNLCPRFGVVTCGEHIAIEPYLFAKYFDGKRYAPRHLGVAADGTKLFDHFLNQDLSIVDRSLKRHGKNADTLRKSFKRDAEALARLEREFLVGDTARRLSMLQRARSATPPQFDLIRLGLHDESSKVRERAAKALASQLTPETMDLVFEALRSGAAENALKALRRNIAPLAKKDPIASKALRILAGLDGSSKIVNHDRWVKAISASTAPNDESQPADIDSLLERLEILDKKLREESTPKLKRENARALLDIAKARIAIGSDPTFFLIDAKSAAEEAEAVAKSDVRTTAIRAEASYLLSNLEEALELAVKALPRHIDWANEPETADLLGLFAKLRAQAIYTAEGNNEEWPASWFTDAHSAYRTLTRHPHADQEHFVAYSQLLSYFGLERENGEALRLALAKYPLSGNLHQQFRDHVWRIDGPFGLERAYERVDLSDRPAAYTWFRAYASLVYAEHLRRVKQPDEAKSAYHRSIRLFGESAKLESDYAQSSNHFAALALAELAFLALERDKLEESQKLILESIERSPESANVTDGLGRSPKLILERVVQVLTKKKAGPRLEALRAQVEQVIPGLLPESDAVEPAAAESSD